MKADLLVCNYNTKDKLEHLLKTINSDYEPDVWTVYVADNDSTDGSYDWLRENADKYRVQTVFKNPNIGYSAAINTMGTVATNDIVVAVNADTWFTTNHVKQALKTFEDNPNQTAMGPKQMDENHLIRHGGIVWNGSKTISPIHRGWSQPDPQDHFFKDRIQCWTVSGSLYYMRREAWDVITNHPMYRRMFPRNNGPLLPTFMYFEETFVSVFLDRLGYEVWYDGIIETAGHSWHASNNPGDNTHHFHESKELYRRTCDMLGINHEV